MSTKLKPIPIEAMFELAEYLDTTPEIATAYFWPTPAEAAERRARDAAEGKPVPPPAFLVPCGLSLKAMLEPYLGSALNIVPDTGCSRQVVLDDRRVLKVRF